MRHLTHIRDLGPAGVRAVLARAAQLKNGSPAAKLPQTRLGMIFLNPSLRTRTSFTVAMHKLGGLAIPLEVGGGVWKLEFDDNAVMNADRTEHVREAAGVLARYCDAIGIRAFANNADENEEEADQVIAQFRKYSGVPVISLESAREHPMQGLADMLTVREQAHTDKPKLVLSWAPHIKPLPRVVPNSVWLSAAAAGFDVTLAHPPGYELSTAIQKEAAVYAQQTGSQLSQTNNLDHALENADVVIAKSWGPCEKNAAPPNAVELQHWRTSMAHLQRAGEAAIFMHCLPVRRDVEVEANLLDSPRSRVLDQAENRLWVQIAALEWLFNDF
jgi:N-acetylornithine carbamoyltransferase